MENNYYVSVGPVCPYCLTETESVCCGEMHHEEGFVECNLQGEPIGDYYLLESELPESSKVLD